MQHSLNPRRFTVMAIAVAVVAAACGGSASQAPSGDGSAAPTTPQQSVSPDKTAVSLWTHSAGNPAEMEKITEWIADFNASQDAYQVVFEAFPQGAYNDTVVAAALANTMPCILDVDGPIVPNWAYAGYLRELDIPQETLDAFLPSTTGLWQGKVYAQGQFDAAVAILARQSDLERLNIRIPTLADPWTPDEFQAALDAYQESGDFDFAFDPGMAWTGEWYPYGFSPLLQSFGGDLIDRDTYLTAEGVLNGDEAVAWGEWWQSLFASGYAPGTSQSGADRDSGFIDGKYGMQWNGIWAANAAIEKFGDDVVFLPAVDFGAGPKIGAASWQWAVSSACPNPEVGDAFINYLLEPERVAAIADAQNVIPGRADARPLTTKFDDGDQFAVFYDLSAAQAVIRPPTPAYLAIAKIFEKAAADIANGANVQTTLDNATDQINADIDNNNGYGF
ncbi:MAG TPA: extracellular solute-binding protein [Candidatus Limnocylindrales bacterium]|nr:extracellular solute-binding protein [Candidatus Limnocylindrales bacterium]